MDTKAKYAEKIKQIIINLAVEDVLPTDLTQLNAEVFEGVFEPLVNTLLTLSKDAEMALNGDWDKSDDGFEAQINLISEVL